MVDQQKGKDTLMRLLLTTPIASSYSAAQGMYGHLNTSHYSVFSNPASDNEEDDNLKLTKYLQRIASQNKEDHHIVLIDHGYSKPWNWRCENSFVKPTRYLFFTDELGSCVAKYLEKNSKSFVPHADYNSDEEIDIDGVVEEIVPCNLMKARPLMEECENHVNTCRPKEEEKDDWEESISKISWTKTQVELFEKVMKLLNSDRMTRLTKSGKWNEPIWRRLVVNKSARRFRVALADVGWDMRLAQWLHITLMDNLNNIYLAIYLDILQKLRSKIPTLVDRMINVSTHVGKTSLGNADNLCNLLKRPWEPVKSYVSLPKPYSQQKKLPSNPILMIIPATPRGLNMQSGRTHFWLSYFSALGQVITVSLHSGSGTSKLLMTSVLDQMVAATRAKIAEVRVNHPNKPIILIGWNSGASLACQVSMMEQVVAVVCLGFPMMTVDGKRGEPNDILLDLRSPTLFVLGEMASTVNQEDIEDMRERMRVETSLVMVASADDKLRMSWSKKMLEGTTQSMVDRVILDEVADFLARILMQPFPAALRQTQVYTPLAPQQQATAVENSRPLSAVKVERKPLKSVATSDSTSVVNTSVVDSDTVQNKSRSESPTSTSAVTTVESPGSVSSFTALVPVTGNSPGVRKKRGQPLQKLQMITANLDTTSAADGNLNGSSFTTRSTSSQSSGEMSTGITVNIGSLASLAPVGPIRFGPLSKAGGDTSDTVVETTRSTSSKIQNTVMSGLNSSNSTVQIRNSIPRARRHNLGRGRGISHAATSLSSFLQKNSGVKAASSSTYVLETSESQIQGVSSSSSSQSSVSVTTSARLLSTSGRIIDISNFAILSSGLEDGDKTVPGAIGSGNVVMLSDSVRSGSSLVPLSGIGNSVAIVPLGGDRHIVGRRSVAVVSKIQGVTSETSLQTETSVPRFATYTVTSTQMQKQKLQRSKQTVSTETLTPDKILDLPIIFAKDDDTIISETDTPTSPIVVPITSSSEIEESASFVTSCDTISFPLEDSTEETSEIVKSSGAGVSGQNIIVIKSPFQKEQSQANKVSMFDKSVRLVQHGNKMASSSSTRTNQAAGGNVKCTKIYFEQNKAPFKISSVDSGDEPPVKRSRFELKTTVEGFKKSSFGGRFSTQ